MKRPYVIAGVVCLVVGSVAQLAQFVISPIAGDMSTTELLDNAAAHHDAMSLALALDAPLLLVIPAVLFAGYLAASRTSTFAGVATAVTLLSGIAAAVLIAYDVVIYQAAMLPDRVSAISMVDGFANNPLILTLTVFFLVGHVVGFALLGFALWRNRAIPVAVAVGLALWPVLEMVGYDNNNTWVAGAGYALQAIAFCFCAVRLVGKEWPSTAASMPQVAATPQWSS